MGVIFYTLVLILCLSAPHPQLLFTSSYSVISPHRPPLYASISPSSPFLFHHLTLLSYSVPSSYLTRTPVHHTVQKHLVYTMERAVAVGEQAAKSEKIVLIIDYEGFTLSGGPPLKTSQETLSILQNHYPERLQCAYLIRLMKTLIIIHSLIIFVALISSFYLSSLLLSLSLLFSSFLPSSVSFFLICMRANLQKQVHTRTLTHASYIYTSSTPSTLYLLYLLYVTLGPPGSLMLSGL